MARVVPGLAVLGLLLLLAAPAAADSFRVPDSEVDLIELEDYSADLPLGGGRTFSWGLLNRGNASATLQFTAVPSDAAFAVVVAPPSLTLAPDEFREVELTVTAPATGVRHEADVELRVRASGSASYLARSAALTASPRATAPGVVPSLLAAGSIIVIGFAASLLFQRTKVPEHLFLILLGILLGPVAAGLFGIVLVSADVLAVLAPYLSALALMIILFDGGLNLDFRSLEGYLALSVGHTLAVFLATTGAVAAVAVLLLGYPLAVALLLGAILGGISGAVVIGLVRRMDLSPEVQGLLTLEAAVTDVLCTVAVVAGIEYLAAGASATWATPALSLVRSLSLGVVFGALAGVAMLLALLRLSGKPYGFMLSIGALLVLYAVTEQFGGNGAMASFVYGLLLGNHGPVARRLRPGGPILSDERFKQFHGEITFLTRTFFFVFLGLVFTLRFEGPWTVSTAIPGLSALNSSFALLLLGILLVFAAIAGVRFGLTAVTNSFLLGTPRERRVIATMMDRGLTAAVLAALPFTVPAFLSGAHPAHDYYRGLLEPHRVEFLLITVFVLLLTLGATTVGVVGTERAARREPKPPPGAPPLLLEPREPSETPEDDTWRFELPPKVT